MLFKLRAKSNNNKKTKNNLVKQVDKDGHIHCRIYGKTFNSIKKGLKLFYLCVW